MESGFVRYGRQGDLAFLVKKYLGYSEIWIQSRLWTKDSLKFRAVFNQNIYGFYKDRLWIIGFV